MKTPTSIFTIGFLLICFSSYSQVKTEPGNSYQSPESSVITKGYYSIGNHGRKAHIPSPLRIKTRELYPAVQKGYYSIGKNNRKLGKQILIEVSDITAIPVTTKGYYSIDRNNEKLKQ
jgi:hypothetical protein